MPYIRIARNPYTSPDNSETFLDMKSLFTGNSYPLVYQEPTSLENPVFILNLSTLNVDFGANYACYFEGEWTNPTRLRFYFIDDTVQVTNDICEIHCSMDYLTTFLNFDSFFKGRIHGVMETCTLKKYWDNTAQETRFNPQKPHVIMDNDFDCTEFTTSDSYSGDGAYFIKWYGGNFRNSTYCMICDDENFRNFIYQVTNFIANHPEAILSGVSDWTQFIYSAKFFPRVSPQDLATAAGYVQLDAQNQLVLGGLVIIENLAGWVHVDNVTSGGPYSKPFPGYATLHFGDITLVPLGNTSGYKYMNFLVSNKWMDIQLITPLGYMSIPADKLNNGDVLNIIGIIDLDVGSLTYYIRRKIQAATGSIDTYEYEYLDSINGSCYIDAMNRIVRIASFEERILRSGVAAGATAVMNPTHANLIMTSGVINGMLGSGEVNMHTGSGGQSIGFLAGPFPKEEMMLGKIHIRQTIYGNSNTPIKTNASTRLAADIDTNYNDWCSNHDGYIALPDPVNLSTVLSDFNSDTATRLRIKFREIEEMRLNMSPKAASTIKQALLNGVTIFKTHS